MGIIDVFTVSKVIATNAEAKNVCQTRNIYVVIDDKEYVGNASLTPI